MSRIPTAETHRPGIRRVLAGLGSGRRQQGQQGLLYVLMVPTMTMIFTGAVFAVAVPPIRTDFGIETDTAAWLVTAYTLPFMVFMPLYGRLGDSLGKRNLLLAGLAIFATGTVVTLSALSLGWFLIGRAVQGAGTAGIAPLSMAVISERFASQERGRALGTWNSVGPAVNIVGPLLAGAMIDRWGWRTIFLPMLLLALLAVVVVWWRIPSLRSARFGRLATFDWGGVLLLLGSVSTLVLYVSSRPVTGVEPLRDWRLLLLALLFGFGFYHWEKRRPDPLVAFAIFRDKSFRLAATGSGLRMFAMSGVSFLLPLYLADIHGLSAAATGGLMMLSAGALLVTMRMGGQLADRLTSRWPVTIGMIVQAVAMGCLAMLPATASQIWVALALVIQGLGAGLALAPLHRSALSHIPVDESGAAAGVYSMIRFGGTLMGAALGGVLLQQMVAQGSAGIVAYQTVYWVIAGVAVLGAVVGWRLDE